MEGLNGRTAIITGGSCGIGREIALRLAEEGCNIVVADIRDEPVKSGKPTHEKIKENGENALFVNTDVSNKQSVQKMVDKAVEEFGQVDILVNNAGIYLQDSIHKTEEENWDKLMSVDMKGVYLCSKEVISHMLENDIEGDIINISSIAGLVGFGESAAYCAAKGGVTELTREMALDYADKGINVNAINPGVIKTQMTQNMREDEKMSSFLNQNTPKGRLGKPEDIAAAAAFLASDEADFIVGHNLVVDGGWTAH